VFSYFILNCENSLWKREKQLFVHHGRESIVGEWGWLGEKRFEVGNENCGGTIEFPHYNYLTMQKEIILNTVCVVNLKLR
jgi:hypothetical protein